MKCYQKGVVTKSLGYTVGIKITQQKALWSGTALNGFAPFLHCESRTHYGETPHLLLCGVAKRSNNFGPNRAKQPPSTSIRSSARRIVGASGRLSDGTPFDEFFSEQ
jgi:hypothetical protein